MAGVLIKEEQRNAECIKNEMHWEVGSVQVYEKNIHKYLEIVMDKKK